MVKCFLFKPSAAVKIWKHYLCSIMSYTYEYPRPALTVDTVVIKPSVSNKMVLLIQRKFPPFEGFWALPGGFVNMDEDLDEAARRELQEETGIQITDMKQFKAYGHPQRDPRHRTVTIVYLAVVEELLLLQAGDDAATAAWFDMNDLPMMAFDHLQILTEILESFPIKSLHH